MLLEPTIQTVGSIDNFKLAIDHVNSHFIKLLKEKKNWDHAGINWIDLKKENFQSNDTDYQSEIIKTFFISNIVEIAKKLPKNDFTKFSKNYVLEYFNFQDESLINFPQTISAYSLDKIKKIKMVNYLYLTKVKFKIFCQLIEMIYLLSLLQIMKTKTYSKV